MMRDGADFSNVGSSNSVRSICDRKFTCKGKERCLLLFVKKISDKPTMFIHSMKYHGLPMFKSRWRVMDNLAALALCTVQCAGSRTHKREKTIIRSN
jgi:hypothetical protein